MVREKKLIKKNGMVFCLASAAICDSLTTSSTWYSPKGRLEASSSFSRAAEIPWAGSTKISVQPSVWPDNSDSVERGTRAVAPLVCLRKTVS